MDTNVRTSSDQKITLLVFKDNFAARTFQVPSNWIRKLGLIVVFFSICLVTGSIFTFKYFQLSKKGKHLPELTFDPHQEQEPIAPPPEESEEMSKANPVNTNLFQHLTRILQKDRANTDFSGLAIQNLKAYWEENRVKIEFLLQNAHPDRSAQQGRIILAVRGPGRLFLYPSSVLTDSAHSGLLAIEYGEPFSISKFREVKADFGPVSSLKELKEAEIFILNRSGTQLYLYQRVPLNEQKDNKNGPSKVAPTN